MFIYACFSLLISKITNSKIILVGTPISLRNTSDLERVMGPFLNTVVIKNEILDELSFKDFLLQTKENVLNAFNNQDYSFDDLVNSLGVKNDLSRNPLFDTLYVHQSIDYDEFKIKDLNFERVIYDRTSAKFDLKLSSMEANNQLYFNFEYRTSLFKLESIEQFIKYLKNIITNVIENRDIAISEISMSSEKDYELFYSDLTDDLSDEI
jgi:non-ribosomal peptide synthetase component F